MTLMKKKLPLFSFLFFATVLRITWKLYTHHTYEDAFISFRFARNISNGLGFVYNANEHIYGTTTPLFTILLAAWTRVFPNFIVFGASMFGLLAGLTSIALTWKLLDELQIDSSQKFLTIGILVLSDKLWLHDMSGMETPLVICAMMASYFMLLRNKSVWAGVFAGILLWLRIDGIFWLCFLVLGSWFITRRFPIKFVMTTIMVYLPWCVFATIYFGSPIPYTISAKWVAYYTIGRPSVFSRVSDLLRWLTPFSLPSFSPYLVTLIAIVTLTFSAIGAMAYRQHKWLMILPFFCLAEIARLVVMGETFATRYFVPLFWVLMILFGSGLHAVWVYLSRRFDPKPLIVILTIAVYVGVSLWSSLQAAQLNKDTQYFVNDSSLKQLGFWLNANTPTSSTVFLEPLGYVGFYANRHMIDEVGLVSPQVIALKKEGYSTFDLITSFNPDYAVLHCDDALQASDAFLARYVEVIELNPMDFNPHVPVKYDPENSSEFVKQNTFRPRAACYQIWEK